LNRAEVSYHAGVDEGREGSPHHGVPDRLDEWREAERDAATTEPGSAAHEMARKRADAAREEFHEAEDVEREVQGNHRPRKHLPDEQAAEESTG
jgi:hypothetical protein